MTRSRSPYSTSRLDKKRMCANKEEVKFTRAFVKWQSSVSIRRVRRIDDNIVREEGSFRYNDARVGKTSAADVASLTSTPLSRELSETRLKKVRGTRVHNGGTLALHERFL